MADMVLHTISLYLLVTVSVTVGGFRVLHVPPEPNIYYTIVDGDGNNLGVDPASYRRSLEKMQDPVANAVVTLPANGDYEKWSILEHNTGMFYIINKATGLYLTVGPIHSDQWEGEIGYSVRKRMEKYHDLQCFSLKPKGFFSDSYHISHGDEFFVTSLKSPNFDAPQTPLYSIKAKYLSKRAEWRFQRAYCDPHPNQMYQIEHYQSGRRLVMVPFHNGISAVDDPITTGRENGFVFVPIEYDKKVYYIQNYESGRVITVWRSNKYGSLLGQDDKDETEQNLSQQWFIQTSPDGRKCLFGSAASYRYLGLNNNSYAIQKEQTATLDEYWFLERSF